MADLNPHLNDRQLSRRELNLLEDLRVFEEVFYAPNDSRAVVPPVLRLISSFNGQLLNGCDIVTGDREFMIHEFARAGIEARSLLLSDDWKKNVIAAQGKAARKRDAVLKSMSWKDVKENLLPSYVKGVTFNVDKEDLAPERLKDMQERFGDVTLCRQQHLRRSEIQCREIEPELVRRPPLQRSRITDVQSVPTLPQTTPSHLSEISALSTCPIKAEDTVQDMIIMRDVSTSPMPMENISLQRSAISNLSTAPAEIATHDRSTQTDEQDPLVLESQSRLRRSTKTAIPVPDETAFVDQDESISREHQGCQAMTGISSEGTPSILEQDSRSPTPISRNLRSNDDFVLMGAEQSGLELAHPQAVQSMYLLWSKENRITSYDGKMDDLHHYYNTILDLYIIASKKRKKDLAFSLLLKFQDTNFQVRDPDNGLPFFEVAVKACQFLGVNSPFCEWITILLAFLWSPTKYDEHNFQNDFGTMDPLTVAKVLYSIAKIRDLETVGHDYAVLQNWCKVHKHHPGSLQASLCKKSFDSWRDYMNQAAKDEQRHQLAKAMKITEPVSSKSKKRKHRSDEDVPAYGNAKRGRGQGRGRDRGSGMRVGVVGNQRPSRPTPTPESPRMRIPNSNDASSSTPEQNPRVGFDLLGSGHTVQLDNDGRIEESTGQLYAPSARVQALYNSWERRGTIPIYENPPVQQSTASLEEYNEARDMVHQDLIDLLIYSRHQKVKPGFEQAVFRLWQKYDYTPVKYGKGDYHYVLPELHCVEKAFRGLQRDHFFLKHLVRLFTCRWATDIDIPSMEHYQPRGPDFERFLLGVCRHRALPSRDLGNALLWRWCEFHQHKSEKERQECEKQRKSLAKNGWQKQWEKSMEAQKKLNLTLKDLSVDSFPSSRNEHPGIMANSEGDLVPELGSASNLVARNETRDKYPSAETEQPTSPLQDDRVNHTLNHDHEYHAENHDVTNSSPVVEPPGLEDEEDMDSLYAWPLPTGQTTSSARRMFPGERKDACIIASGPSEEHLTGHNQSIVSDREQSMHPTIEQRCVSSPTHDIASGSELPVTNNIGEANRGGGIPYTPSGRVLYLYEYWKRNLSFPVHHDSGDIPSQQSTAFPDGGQTSSDRAYEDLLDLLIFSRNQQTEKGFEEEIWLELQKIDFLDLRNKKSRSDGPRDGPVPDLAIVSKAFAVLPKGHFLSKHLPAKGPTDDKCAERATDDTHDAEAQPNDITEITSGSESSDTDEGTESFHGSPSQDPNHSQKNPQICGQSATPGRSEGSEYGTPSRRSNRTTSATPGFFKERPSRKYFSKTMWKGF